MASAEIAPPSKHMTPNNFITITSAKKIMIMQLIVAKYYRSLSHKTKVQTVKNVNRVAYVKSKPVEWPHSLLSNTSHYLHIDFYPSLILV